MQVSVWVFDWVFDTKETPSSSARVRGPLHKQLFFVDRGSRLPSLAENGVPKWPMFMGKILIQRD